MKSIYKKVPYKENIVVGIDASRNRSGGAVAHILGIIIASNPKISGIETVHLWVHKSLHDLLPERNWLQKHIVSDYGLGIVGLLIWQKLFLRQALKKNNCCILFSSDASSLCRFHTTVVMSQDMLSYEEGIIDLFGITKARLRLHIIKYVQNRALKSADGTIFLTEYARKVIERSCGKFQNYHIIPHGIPEHFRSAFPMKKKELTSENVIRCIYVSNTALYKNQWNVVRAIRQLRDVGYFIELTLVGGGKGKAAVKLQKELDTSDPSKEFVKMMDFIPNLKLPELLCEHDIFIFASSCENLPVTLLEAMAVGIPIICSNKGPMPEVLKDGGLYFDPTQPKSIASALVSLLDDEKQREKNIQQSRSYADNYSWERCGNETWQYLAQIVNQK